jgi:carboxypeptidase C (cathepsin A)
VDEVSEEPYFTYYRNPFIISHIYTTLLFKHSGGPGCSGLLGFGAEHGPFHVSSHQTLHENPFSWNRVANVIYLEQPAGVGFSYGDDPDDYNTGDKQAALDNYNFILQFLEKFPERKSNPFYISSESYGGHYMPQLALEILQRDTGRVINFRGFMVGNPYVDPYSNMVTQFESYYSHGLLAKPLFDEWSTKCRNRKTWMTSECDALTDAMLDQFESGINVYALDYPICIDKKSKAIDPYARGRRRLSHSRMNSGNDGESDTEEIPKTSSPQVNALFNQTGRKSPEDSLVYKPCMQVNLENYLNELDVRAALHVHIKKYYPHWSPCGGINYNADDDKSVVDLYQQLVDMAIRGDHDLQMLVYSGDNDSICSTAGTQYWLWNLGVNASSPWNAWHVDGQVAGFHTLFDLPSESKATFSFVTVHGAGHEVPAYRPAEALELFARFLEKRW